MTVTIKAVAIHLPDTYLDAHALAKQMGVEVSYVTDSLGIKRKAISDSDAVALGLRAAEKILAREDPTSIDLVIWTGAGEKPHDVWSASSYIQEKLCLTKAWCFDLFAQSAGDLVALRVASDMMASNPTLRRILLVGGHKISNLVNALNPKTHQLMDFADGGSAILLETGVINPVLKSHSITDGSFAEKYMLENFTHKQREFVQRFKPGDSSKIFLKSIVNYCNVIRTAIDISQLDFGVQFLGLNHVNPIMHTLILKQVGVRPEQSWHDDGFGHVGCADPWLSLLSAERNKILSPGKAICLAAAGFGYTWTATCIEWHKNIVIDDLA